MDMYAVYITGALSTYPLAVLILSMGFALTASSFWQTPSVGPSQKYPKGLRPTIRPSSPRLARRPASPPHNSTCVQPPVRGLRVVPTVLVADLDLPPHRESRHGVPTERGRSEGTTESPDTANLEKTSQFSRWMGIKTTV